MGIIKVLTLILWLYAPSIAKNYNLRHNDEYSNKAWQYLADKNWKELMDVTNTCIKKFGKKARSQQKNSSFCLDHKLKSIDMEH